MNFNFLSPVSDAVLAHNELLSQQALGKKLKIHSKQAGIPDLENVKIAIIGVLENRNDINYIGEELQFDEEKVNAIRNELRNSCYLSFTLGGFLSEIEQDYFKLELAKELAAKTYDLENLKIYSLGFKTNEFRNEYLNYIKQFD